MDTHSNKLTFADVQAAFDDAMLLADRHYIKAVVATVLGNQLDGPPVWLMLVAASSGGKCLGKDTGIRMYNGSVKLVQNIMVGDLLMGDDSTPRKVLSTTSGKDMLYEVIQQNGDNYVVNSQHILTLKNTVARADFHDVKPHEIVDIPLPEYLARGRNFQKHLKGVKIAVEYPHREVAVDPYYLGLWLGDGKKDCPIIFKPDVEVRDFVQAYATRLGLTMTQNQSPDKCPGYSIVGEGKGKKNPLTRNMKNYGLVPDKFIPTDYLINDKKTRLELLAGLIDSDGHRSDRGGRFVFSNKNERLSREVVDLARSLGFKASIHSTTKSIRSIGFTGHYWDVSICGPIHEIPTKIERKKAPVHPWKRDMLTTGIEIKKKERGTYYGFELDGNGRFLLEDYTVTHNTAVLLTLDDLELLPGKKVSFFISDLTENTLASGFKSASGEASLLKKLPYGGMFIFKDFTSLLTKRHEARDAIMGQLREVYDQKFDKGTGNNQDVAWDGKVGALAGVTTAVHEYMANMAVMGDRFIMYSIVQPDRKKLLKFVMKMRVSGDSQEKKLLHAKTLLHAYLKQCMHFSKGAKLYMDESDREHLMDVADFATKVRSGVMKDERTGQVRFVPDPEMPTRLIIQLLSLATALSVMREADGIDPNLDKEDMQMLYKVAFDSIPIKRRWAMRELAMHIGGVTTAGLATKIGYETAVAHQWLTELNALGICRRLKGSGADNWILNSEYIAIMETFEKVQRTSGTLVDKHASEDDLLADAALRDMGDLDAQFRQ